MAANSYNLSFYLEKRFKNNVLQTSNVPINLFFSFGGKRLQYFTGYRIDSDKWDGAKYRIKPKYLTAKLETAEHVNRELKRIEDKVQEIFEGHCVLKTNLSVEQLRNELKQALGIEIKKSKIAENTVFARYETYVSVADVSESRRKQLHSSMNHFKRFLSNDSICFDEITVDTIKEFKKYLDNDKDAPKCNNTVTIILKKLRAFFNYAVAEKWLSESPMQDFKIEPEKYYKPIYITKDERNLLFDAELSNLPRLERVRDIFVFQCLIGCRVGDLVKLTNQNIIDGAIHYVANKTKDEKPDAVRVPLSDKAKEILNRYNLPDGKLLPFITDQRYNEYIKQLFEVVGLTRQIIRNNPKTGISESVRLCDIATSHMARKTFIGGLHKTVKDSVIASMSGHKKDSRAFARYYDIDDETQNDAIKNLD